MKTLKIASLLTLVLLLTACNNSSNELEKTTESEGKTVEHIIQARPTQDVINPAGIWIGHQSILSENGKGVFDMKTLIYDGKFYGVSEDANIFYSGSYEMSHGKHLTASSFEDSNTSYKMYSISENGKPFSNGVISLAVSNQNKFSGDFVNDVHQEGNIEATFTNLYNKESSLEYLQSSVNAGDLNITIDNSGVLSGSKNECEISGNIEVPDSSVNMYILNFTLSTCDDSGEYRGLGIVAQDSNSSTYFMSFVTSSDELRMDALSFYLDNTPSNFSTKAPKRRSGILSPFTTDLTDSDFSHKNITDLNVITDKENHKNLGEQDFTGSDFSYFIFNGGYCTVFNNYFDDVDFYEAELDASIIKYAQIFGDGTDDGNAYAMNSFTNANFEASNIDKLEFSLVAGPANNFSSAWWVDGRRCGVISFNECSSRLIDTGLTYEEYKNNKWEIEKLGENIIEKSSDIAKDAKEFAESAGSKIEDVGSEVISWRPW